MAVSNPNPWASAVAGLLAATCGMLGQMYVTDQEAKQHLYDADVADRVGRVTRLLDLMGDGENSPLALTSSVSDIQFARCILLPERLDCGHPDANFDAAENRVWVPAVQPLREQDAAGELDIAHAGRQG